MKDGDASCTFIKLYKTMAKDFKMWKAEIQSDALQVATLQGDNTRLKVSIYDLPQHKPIKKIVDDLPDPGDNKKKEKCYGKRVWSHFEFLHGKFRIISMMYSASYNAAIYLVHKTEHRCNTHNI